MKRKLKHFTNSESAKLAELYNKGKSLKEISAILNRPYGSVFSRLQTIGLKPNSKSILINKPPRFNSIPSYAKVMLEKDLESLLPVPIWRTGVITSNGTAPKTNLEITAETLKQLGYKLAIVKDE